MLKVKNTSNIEFYVNFVKTGENYGTRKNIPNTGDTLVEFYDTRFEGDYGQFVCRYNVDTVLTMVDGINMGTFDWFLDKAAMKLVHEHINNHYKGVDSYA
jgi:hypothetical protein